MAFAVMDVLRFELGLRVPEDVSVVGFDDVPPAAWPAYNLTTFRQRVDQMVAETVTMLLRRIAGDEAVLTSRPSCAPIEHARPLPAGTHVG